LVAAGVTLAAQGKPVPEFQERREFSIRTRRGGMEIGPRPAVKIATFLLALGLCWMASSRDLPAQRAGAGRGGRPPIVLPGPDLPFTLVERPFTMPADRTFGNVSAIAMNSRGHVFVFHRSAVPIFEFDERGQFVRGFGEGLTTRPHGIKFDSEDNLWITDTGNHTVVKMDPQGNVLMKLGEPGKNGSWTEDGPHLLDQPTDVAFLPNHEFFVTQGHGGLPRVLRFTPTGHLLQSWSVAQRTPDIPTNLHTVMIDADGSLWIADREAGRVLVLDGDGVLKRTLQMPSRVSGLYLGHDGLLYISSSTDGQVIQADRTGKILGVTGAPGTGPGQYGEAHTLTLGAAGEIYVADNAGSRVQKYLPRK
jgi:streptogramin lyase